jgi:hypothetical protein
MLRSGFSCYIRLGTMRSLVCWVLQPGSGNTAQANLYQKEHFTRDLEWNHMSSLMCKVNLVKS